MRKAIAATTLSAGLAYLLLRPRGRSVTPLAVAIEDYFDAADVQRARAYERPQRLIGTAGTLTGLGTLALFAARRPTDLRERGAGATALDGAVLALSLTAAGLPLSALARRRSLAAGLATQSWRDWGLDVGRASAIGTALAGGGAAALWLLVERGGERWWQGAAAASVAIAAIASFAAPVVLDPIFNDFEPLPEGELRSSVLELAERAGVRVGGVYSVDASRRTTAVNAYVGGLGATRRIVLYDTLIERFSDAQTRLVVAHELAHVRGRDVPRGLAFAAIVAAPSAYATARIAPSLTPEGSPETTTLPAVALAAALVGALTGPFAGALSRAVERRADAFALELTGDADSFIEFEQEITRSNLADPAPARWRTLLASHPSAIERIGAAAAFAARR
jgi:STE24 endopeptidase